MDKKTAKKKIEDAIVGRKVLELSGIADDNDKRDFTVIPLCIKEHGGKQYLIATSRLDRWFAFYEDEQLLVRSERHIPEYPQSGWYPDMINIDILSWCAVVFHIYRLIL